MRHLALAVLLIAGWGNPPAQPPTNDYQYRVLPPPQHQNRPVLETPQGPAQGSIEKCLRIYQHGGVSC